MKILKRLNKVESASLEKGREISFNNLGGGISFTVYPFDTLYEGTGYHVIGFNCYSSGSVEFQRKISKEEENKLKSNDRPSKLIKEEAMDFFNKEIFKVAQEFDKKIADIAKKYGYTKKK